MKAATRKPAAPAKLSPAMAALPLTAPALDPELAEEMAGLAPYEMLAAADRLAMMVRQIHAKVAFIASQN